MLQPGWATAKSVTNWVRKKNQIQQIKIFNKKKRVEKCRNLSRLQIKNNRDMRVYVRSETGSYCGRSGSNERVATDAGSGRYAHERGPTANNQKCSDQRELQLPERHVAMDGLCLQVTHS